jgi:hypothetical protein
VWSGIDATSATACDPAQSGDRVSALVVEPLPVLAVVDHVEQTLIEPLLAGEPQDPHRLVTVQRSTGLGDLGALLLGGGVVAA